MKRNVILISFPWPYSFSPYSIPFHSIPSIRTSVGWDLDLDPDVDLVLDWLGLEWTCVRTGLGPGRGLFPRTIED
jgi:hypothetical protein